MSPGSTAAFALALAATTACGSNSRDGGAQKPSPAASPRAEGPSPGAAPAGNPAPADCEGWRYERIDFPLPFAPDLGLDGYEELRFAPGMFKPESETYFTYAFIMVMEGDPPRTATALKTLLESYFRGLMTAVGADKELQLAPGAITARVTTADSAERSFVAEVDLVDAFVTGRRFVLHMNLHLAGTEPGTCLAVTASPRPRTDPVWTQMDGVRSRCLPCPSD